eukprot:scaffold16447_cov116-Isochrysis_galbana.AAC.4
MSYICVPRPGRTSSGPYVSHASWNENVRVRVPLALLTVATRSRQGHRQSWSSMRPRHRERGMTIHQGDQLPPGRAPGFDCPRSGWRVARDRVEMRLRSSKRGSGERVCFLHVDCSTGRESPRDDGKVGLGLQDVPLLAGSLKRSSISLMRSPEPIRLKAMSSVSVFSAAMATAFAWATSSEAKRTKSASSMMMLLEVA